MDGENKYLQLIRQIQEMHQQGIRISEISRRTGKDVGTFRKYREGDLLIFCHRGKKGKSILDPYRYIIIENWRQKSIRQKSSSISWKMVTLAQSRMRRFIYGNSTLYFWSLI